jgi:hypothetical protein
MKWVSLHSLLVGTGAEIANTRALERHTFCFAAPSYESQHFYLFLSTRSE